MTPDSTAPAAAPPGVTVCAACAEPITDVYYEGNGKIVCPRCRDAVLASRAGGSGFARFLKATLYGIGAGIVGAGIWYGVRAGTGYEVGLIAIVVGILVGGAIKAGSQGRGGVGYQLLAVLLTYLGVMRLTQEHYPLTEHLPLVMLAIFLGLAGVQLVTLGLLAEIQTRTYHESQNKPVYRIETILKS